MMLWTLLACFRKDSAYVDAEMTLAEASPAPAPAPHLPERQAVAVGGHKLYTYLRFSEVFLDRLAELPPERAARIQAGEEAVPFSLVLQWIEPPQPTAARVAVRAIQGDQSSPCAPDAADHAAANEQGEIGPLYYRCDLRFAPVTLEVRYYLGDDPYDATIQHAPGAWEYWTYNALWYTLTRG